MSIPKTLNDKATYLTPFNIQAIRNLDEVLNHQVQNLNTTRQLVKDLKFIPVDPVAIYSAVTYKAIDGGKLGIYFDPFEVYLVKVADFYGNEPMAFLGPTTEKQGTDSLLGF